MKKNLYSVVAIISFSFLLIAAVTTSPFSHSIVVAPVIPTSMSLAGEQVPMEDCMVKEAVDRELMKHL